MYKYCKSHQELVALSLVDRLVTSGRCLWSMFMEVTLNGGAQYFNDIILSGSYFCVGDLRRKYIPPTGADINPQLHH